MRAHGGTDAAPLAKMLYESRFRQQVQSGTLDLTNRETLQALRERKLPTPGQAPKVPPASRNDSNLGHE